MKYYIPTRNIKTEKFSELTIPTAATFFMSELVRGKCTTDPSP
jgi:hypothetical protein